MIGCKPQAASRRFPLPQLFCAVLLLTALVPVVAHAALPESLSLTVGEVQPLKVNAVQRIVIGDPDVIDITVVTEHELLVRALKAGATTLIVWDADGQQTAKLTVAQRKEGHSKEQVGRLLEQLGFGEVTLKQEGDRLFLIGEVASEADQQRLEQLLGEYPDVTNLVAIRAAPPTPEVVPQAIQLAVQVIELSQTDLEKLGIKWSEAIKFTEATMSAASYGDTAFRIGEKVSRDPFTQTLNMLVRNNKARILAEPKLLTSSGKEATSFMGQEIPIVSATSAGTGVSVGTISSTVEFKEVGVTLKILPTVLSDGQRIRTQLQAEVSFLDSSTAIQVGSATVPGLKTRKIQTEVVTETGQTIVIAGLLQSEESKSVDQVPGFGSVPVLGRLFRSPQAEIRRTNLVITVTPELKVDEAQETDRRLALEQAMAVAEVTGSVEDPRLRYALTIQERIAKALRYPMRERELNISGRVKLKLHLFSDGTLGRAAVAESSGIEALDMEALKAAETQAPYPPFPSQVVERELWLNVPVIFRPS